MITASKSEGVKWEGNCAGKQEGKRSLQNLSAINFLSIFPAPIAFTDIYCDLNESKSKDLKMSHKFRFWMAHLPLNFGRAGA
ncbi:MAG: hypothetical protein YYHSYBAR_001377 [Candidatus Fervidibacter sacchari]